MVLTKRCNSSITVITKHVYVCLIKGITFDCRDSHQSYGNIGFHAQFKSVPCVYFSDYYNYDGKNGEGGLSKSPSAPGSAQGSYGSYYQDDGYCNPASAAKALKKKPPIHKGGKPLFQDPLGTSSASAGSYLSSSALGQASFNQYSQVYGQGKRSFSQNQGGTGAFTCNTAYPVQVTGGAGGSQEYTYEGELRF